jgi:hypothetical protein
MGYRSCELARLPRNAPQITRLVAHSPEMAEGNRVRANRSVNLVTAPDKRTRRTFEINCHATTVGCRSPTHRSSSSPTDTAWQLDARIVVVVLDLADGQIDHVQLARIGAIKASDVFLDRAIFGAV